MKISFKAKNAILIGMLCSVSYLAVYIARNVLSAATPQMLESGAYSSAYIGKVSSMYFIFYAVGQLVNGAIGDKIKAKYMISTGLLLAGAMSLLFPYMSAFPNAAMVIYALTGFFLAMIYGPMTKIVSENTEPIHATRCSLGYTFASFLGSPLAGAMAAVLVWQSVFIASSAVLFIMAVTAFVCFIIFEKKGLVKYGQYKPKEKGKANLKVLLKYDIIKFSLIAVITGVVRTAVVFWLPTYIAQYLGFSAKTSAAIFTAATLALSSAAFISVFVYERLNRDMNKTVFIMFVSATLFFGGAYFIKLSAVNIIFLTLAIIASNGAATMLWSRYCPGLRDTGMVSSVTGFLDFLSYMSASAANIIFANAAESVGWSNLILIWMGIMVAGVLVAFPYSRLKKKDACRCEAPESYESGVSEQIQADSETAASDENIHSDSTEI